MGRPPSAGAPAFRFLPSEVAEMEARLLQLNNGIPTRAVLQTLADKFSASPERAGKVAIQPKQVRPALLPPASCFLFSIEIKSNPSATGPFLYEADFDLGLFLILICETWIWLRLGSGVELVSEQTVLTPGQNSQGRVVTAG